MLLFALHVVVSLTSSAPGGLSPTSTALSLEGYVRVPLALGGVAAANSITSPYARATIGDTEVTFLIDTGATNSYLDLTLAKQLGLKLRDSGGVINVNGVRHPTQATEVTDFRLGEVVRRGPTRFDVYDMAKIIAHHKGAHGVEFHGIIGTNFLEAYSAIIDYRHKCMYLNDPSAWDLNLIQGSWKGVGCEWEGDVITDKNYVSQARAVVRGEEFEFQHGGVTYTGSLQFDGIKSPKRYVVSNVKKNGKLIPECVIGLYEVDKARLRLMIPVKDPVPQRLEDLPTSFKTSTANGMAMFTFEKASALPQSPPPRLVPSRN